MEDAHCKTVDEVLNYFSVDPERGLTPDQIKRNQEKYGPNGKFNLYFMLLDLSKTITLSREIVYRVKLYSNVPEANY